MKVTGKDRVEERIRGHRDSALGILCYDDNSKQGGENRLNNLPINSLLVLTVTFVYVIRLDFRLP